MRRSDGGDREAESESERDDEEKSIDILKELWEGSGEHEEEA